MTKLPRPRAWQWIVLILLLALVADWAIQRPDGRTRELNQAIEAKGSPQLKSYPYQFRVVRVEGSTAVMTTPRNFDVPAFRFIGVIHPGIDVRNSRDPAFIAAQTTLGLMQSEASRLVAEQPGIKYVQWELDRKWLAAHGIEVPAK